MKYNKFLKQINKRLRKSNKISVIGINKKYIPGYSMAADMLRMEWAMIDEFKTRMKGSFDNIFSIWKLYELGEFEILTEYNGFLTGE